ncbi:MAG: isocitrate lyase/phosphoenolpyruvate mutase family protein [Pseudomonadales bacterium]
MSFRDLHYQAEPLLLCNVWDVPSAMLANKLGFKAAGTSSAALAHSLGYKDGEQLAFSILYERVRRITECVDIPLSVDLEAGYGESSTQVLENVLALADLGVVGINIEDSLVGAEVNAERELVESKKFAGLLDAISLGLKAAGVDVFVNARTDVFLLGCDSAVERTVERIQVYTEAGAHGIFVPCIVREDDIAKVADACSLPLNVMCMPGLPDFEVLKNSNVKRISMGNFAYNSMVQNLEHSLAKITDAQSFASLF